MNNVKHIHEVLFIFQEIGSFKNEETLLEIIKERHGDDVTFISCSNEPFGLEYVVPFLLSKGNKIVLNEDGSLELHPAMKMCDGHLKHQQNQ